MMLVTLFRSWWLDLDPGRIVGCQNWEPHLKRSPTSFNNISLAQRSYHVDIYSKFCLAEISFFALILCAIYRNEVIPILEIRHENSRFVLEKWHDGGVMMDEIEGGGGAVVYD